VCICVYVCVCVRELIAWFARARERNRQTEWEGRERETERGGEGGEGMVNLGLDEGRLTRGRRRGRREHVALAEGALGGHLCVRDYIIIIIIIIITIIIIIIIIITITIIIIIATRAQRWDACMCYAVYLFLLCVRACVRACVCVCAESRWISKAAWTGGHARGHDTAEAAAAADRGSGGRRQRE
jgi:hypothetical protein